MTAAGKLRRRSLPKLHQIAREGFGPLALLVDPGGLGLPPERCVYGGEPALVGLAAPAVSRRSVTEAG